MIVLGRDAERLWVVGGARMGLALDSPTRAGAPGGAVVLVGLLTRSYSRPQWRRGLGIKAMVQALISYDGYILAFVALIGTVAAALFLLWLSQRSRYSDRIKEFRGVVPPFVGIPGILFALNLVFLANDTWGAHDRALNAVYQEAGALSSIMTIAKLLPDPARAEVVTAVEKYVNDVVSIEWPRLALRQTYSVVFQDLDQLTALIASRTLLEAMDKNTHGFLITQLGRVRDAHSQRIILSRTGINPLKWLGMAILGLITTISIVMVHVDQAKAELLAVLLFAAAATPTAVIVLVQGNPFQQPTELVATPIACVIVPGAVCERLP
jgi:hypothetical protein